MSFLFELESETPRKGARKGRPAAETTNPMHANIAPGPVGVGVRDTAAGPKPRKKRKPKPQVAADVQPTVRSGKGWWSITFPAPERMLSVNSGNQHWRKTSPIRKAFREAMFGYAQFAKLPKGLARIRVDVVLRFPTGGRRDVGNYYTHVVKPCVDGLGPESVRVSKNGPGGTWKQSVAVGYGLIADDTAEYLDGPHLQLGEPIRDKAMPYGQVSVVITDLSAEVAA